MGCLFPTQQNDVSFYSVQGQEVSYWVLYFKVFGDPRFHSIINCFYECIFPCIMHPVGKKFAYIKASSFQLGNCVLYNRTYPNAQCSAVEGNVASVSKSQMNKNVQYL